MTGSSKGAVLVPFVWLRSPMLTHLGSVGSVRFREQETTIPGDVLLVTAFISYVGCFTKQYRTELLDKMWFPRINKLEVMMRGGADSGTCLAVWCTDGCHDSRWYFSL